MFVPGGSAGAGHGSLLFFGATGGRSRKLGAALPVDTVLCKQDVGHSQNDRRGQRDGPYLGIYSHFIRGSGGGYRCYYRSALLPLEVPPVSTARVGARPGANHSDRAAC